MEKIRVSLGDRSYPISIDAELLSNSALFGNINPNDAVVIISNETVSPLYSQQLMNTLNARQCQVALLELADGEKYKTLDTFNQIMTFLLEGNYGRDVTLVALGGGVIGDLVGFAAASYQRGVKFIQVPTTLLSQVDSSVGGKTGVNHPLGKNMIGAFYQPQSVVIDINSLSTLPEREFSAGMAEVIKYGIIIDQPFFHWLEQNVDKLMSLDASSLNYAIARCCQIKADVVAADEKEAGVRTLLNLGHTFAHAIEAEMGYGNWLHGEAVAVGMILAAETSLALGLISEAQMEMIKALIKRANLPVKAPKEMSYDSFIRHMMRDKKVLSGRLRLVLPTSIGRSEVIDNTPRELLKSVIINHLTSE